MCNRCRQRCRLSYNEDPELIERIVNREHPRRATFRLLPEVDHYFTRAKTRFSICSCPRPPTRSETLRWMAARE
ncbi:hypothetical protein LJY25_12995 [Hymenobacter sp. BT175]|uniref:hypothetical protein n=1 Tax=Hymenobacter translucens TaxID=2886507 RepID=UPI001D0DD5A9|nr:hypothetical protein [Hymenobacter translucens]MCC2547365.1 hypothetical protein [Hymenobacter translucens]